MDQVSCQAGAEAAMAHIEIIETSGLGDRSYLATDGDLAIVIDPQRDIDRILALLDKHEVRLGYVLETHIHNDYVTGGLELAQRTGAEYVVSADDEVSFHRMPIREGDVLTVGSMRIRALHTPGHTFHHLSYVLEDAEGSPEAVFTGGSMLYGTSGRTDLAGPEHTDILTHKQFSSLRRLAAELPAETRVFPTHGFGSFCSATPASGEDSTIGQEANTNPALTMEEQEYVDSLLSGLDAYPAYYVRMAPINRQGPAPVDLSLPEQVDPAQLQRRIEAGEWVVDLRDRTAFAAGHLGGSLELRAVHQLRYLPRLAVRLGHSTDPDWGIARSDRRGQARASADRRRHACRHGRRRHPSTGRRVRAAVLPGERLRRAGHGQGGAPGACARRPAKRRARAGRCRGLTAHPPARAR